MGCAWAQTKLPAGKRSGTSQRSFRCAKNGVALRANCTGAMRGMEEGNQADFRGNYASKSAIMHKIAETAKNRILRCFGKRRFWGKNGGKNRKNRLAGTSIHHANKSPSRKHEKSPSCIQNAQKCRFRLFSRRSMHPKTPFFPHSKLS